jgi:hypothetical protein
MMELQILIGLVVGSSLIQPTHVTKVNLQHIWMENTQWLLTWSDSIIVDYFSTSRIIAIVNFNIDSLSNIYCWP